MPYPRVPRAQPVLFFAEMPDIHFFHPETAGFSSACDSRLLFIRCSGKQASDEKNAATHNRQQRWKLTQPSGALYLRRRRAARPARASRLSVAVAGSGTEAATVPLSLTDVCQPETVPYDKLLTPVCPWKVPYCVCATLLTALMDTFKVSPTTKLKALSPEKV